MFASNRNLKGGIVKSVLVTVRNRSPVSKIWRKRKQLSFTSSESVHFLNQIFLIIKNAVIKFATNFMPKTDYLGKVFENGFWFGLTGFGLTDNKPLKPVEVRLDVRSRGR